MVKTAIFASGNGSNFEAIVDAYGRGELNAEPVVCVCDKPGAYVIERSRRLGIPVIVASPKDYPSKKEYEEFLLKQLRGLDIGLICLAGYMRIVGETLLGAFPKKIINIHPSMLPDFKGAHAIRDAFESGTKNYGVTVHYVDETLDGGEILLQRRVEYAGDSLDELETAVHAVEHRLFPEAINVAVSKRGEGRGTRRFEREEGC